MQKIPNTKVYFLLLEVDNYLYYHYEWNNKTTSLITRYSLHVLRTVYDTP